MKRFRFLAFALAIGVMILASLSWQSAIIIDTEELLAINGFEASNGIWLLIALPLIVLFGSRYWPQVVANIAATLAFLIGTLASVPIFGLGLEANPALLQSLVAGKLGVAEWSEQQELLTAVQTNNPLILGTAFLLAVLSASNLLSMRKMKK